MSMDCAGGVLVVPMWTSAMYWPFIILCPKGRFISAVIDWIDLQTNKVLCTLQKWQHIKET